MVFTLAVLSSSLGLKGALAMARHEPFDIANMIGAIVILFVTLIFTMTFVIWGFVGWLHRVTAFCRYFSSRMAAAEFVRETVKEDRQRALDETSKEKSAIAKFWLLATLFMLLPLAAIWFLTTGLAMTSPKIAGPLAIQLPLPMVQTLAVALGLLIWVVVTYSMVAVVLSAHCAQNPKGAAVDALRFTFALCPSTFLLALVLSVLVSVISSPDELMNPNILDDYVSGSRDTLVSCASTIWGGVVSVFLWIFPLAPFCELLKDRISGKTDD